MKMTDEIREIINKSRVHLATSSKDGKPNVVPVGFIEAISDHQLLIADIMFDKTRKNLEENPRVSVAVEALSEFKAYQLKGTAEIFTSGAMLDMALDVVKRREEKRRQRYAREQIEEPDWLGKIHQIQPKAAILIEVEEIYSTIVSKEW
jgi:predicted pyridoxine 5'-phosphate oxidase superfamily flavin-nucleotide-binding protein